MRHHGKAPSAGLTQASGAGPSLDGRSLRGRAASAGRDGSGTSSGRLPGSSRIATFARLAVLASLLIMALGAPGARAASSSLDTIGQIGALGDGPGEYEYANGLAVNNKTGNLYVSDPNNSRVEVFDKTGAFLFSFGTEGTGAGQFSKYSSGGLSIDQENGDIYVGELGGPFANYRVSKFDKNGNFILTFGKLVNETTSGDVCTALSGDTCQKGLPGETNGRMNNSTATVDPTTRNILVPSQGIGAIQEFSPSGSLLGSFPAPGVGNHIEAGQDGKIYSGTQEYTHTGTPIGTFAPDTFGPGGGFTPYFPAVRLGPGTSDKTKLRLFAGMKDVNEVWQIGEFKLDGTLLFRHGIGLPPLTDVQSDPLTGHIYASAQANRPDSLVYVLGHPATLPVPTIEPATAITTNSATMNGKINPEGSIFNTGYHFEYRAEGSTSWIKNSHVINEVDVDFDVGNGTSDVVVNEPATNLDPHTTYEFRLVATREKGAGSKTSSITTFTTNPIPPVATPYLVQSSRVTDTTALLKAEVNPEHSDTTYYFEYGTDTAYGSFAPTSQEGDAGHILGRQPVFEKITGLTPNTTYHFCVVTENVAGSSLCVDHTFTTTTTAAQEWPSRGIELVNEPEKGDQSVLLAAAGGRFGRAVSPNGERVSWSVTAGTPTSPSGSFGYFVSHRTPTGWVTDPFAPTPSQQPWAGSYAGDLDFHIIAVNEDLSRFVFNATQGFLAGDIANFALTATTESDINVLQERFDRGDGYYARRDVTQASSDTSYVVIHDSEADDAAGAGTFTVYHDGTATLLNVPSCGGTFAQGDGESPTTTRLFIMSAGSGSCSAPPQLYAIDYATNTPTLISGPADHGLEYATGVAGLSKDGTEVLFATKTALLGTDTNVGPDFYKWVAGSGLDCLTCATPEFAEQGGAGGGNASEDLSHIYFSSAAQLTSDAPATEDRSIHPYGCGHKGDPVRDQCNLYVLRAATGDVHFIGQIGAFSADLTSTMTSDGNVYVFTNGLQGLTPDKLVGSPDHEYRTTTTQLYRYDDRTQNVECLSCVEVPELQPGAIAGSGSFTGRIEVSGDGTTVAWNSSNPLTTRDINGVSDIYEWHNGVVRLVTDGVHEWPDNDLGGAPQMWGLDQDGTDAIVSVGGFRLTGFEHDYYANAYDYRVGGGFVPPNPPAHCTEDACQGPLQAPPALDHQGSSTFHGFPNPTKTPHHTKRKKRARKKRVHQKHKTRHSTGRHG